MRRIKTPYSLEIQKKINPLSVENVLGYIEGSDAVLKNEVVIITAHYDHLGIEHGNTYYGADDDGSGTVALLEIAQAFAQAKSRRQRSQTKHTNNARSGRRKRTARLALLYRYTAYFTP
jgi:Zn-dependent M28 family amino/carboxypeptidase